MMNRFNDPDDLVTLRLRCKVCTAVQKATLRADDKLSEATKHLACCSCGEKGRFRLAPPPNTKVN